jgi:hypothetical protein
MCEQNHAQNLPLPFAIPLALWAVLFSAALALDDYHRGHYVGSAIEGI